jgi:hypothetical protein
VLEGSRGTLHSPGSGIPLSRHSTVIRNEDVCLTPRKAIDVAPLLKATLLHPPVWNGLRTTTSLSPVKREQNLRCQAALDSGPRSVPLWVRFVRLSHLARDRARGHVWTKTGRQSLSFICARDLCCCSCEHPRHHADSTSDRLEVIMFSGGGSRQRVT